MTRLCSIPACLNPHKAKGYCSMHWQRNRYGLPMELPKRYHQLSKKGWIAHGYRWLSTSQGEVMEHRYKMEQHLGRKLHVDECVHHKNGDKLDNRLCNLEVIQRDVHTSHHRAHQLSCIVCAEPDKKGGHGLCGKHMMQVKRFLERFQIEVPERGYARAIIYMGIGLAFGTEGVNERLHQLLHV